MATEQQRSWLNRQDARQGFDRRSKSKLSAAQKQQVQQQRAEGTSVRDLAIRFGVSASHIRYVASLTASEQPVSTGSFEWLKGDA
ncbi:hypothetical protein ACFRCX_30470 [Streptomyces sp. NPDC056652]|uniref:hypothetical protein n=1 Tax=Streptomyces sp. NPDC056652 TaxID=3345893 RepID=UPI0036A00697